MLILLAEQDDHTSQAAAAWLRDAGYEVDAAFTDGSALARCLEKSYDILVVDQRLPDGGGVSFIRSARDLGVQSPVLLLTARSGVHNRLDTGCSDYLMKPFGRDELRERIEALRNSPCASDDEKQLRVGDLTLDLVTKTASRAGTVIDLHPREFVLLETLMRNEGKVISRLMLLEHVWGFQFDPQTNIVETHIRRLRSKIDGPFDEPLLHSVQNLGYSLYACAREGNRARNDAVLLTTKSATAAR